MTCYVVISIIKTMTVAICLTLTGASRGSCPCCSGTLLEPEHTSFVCCLSTLASEQPQWRCGKASTMMADLVPEHMNVMQQFLSLKLAKDQLLMGIWVCLSMKLCHSMSRHLNAAGGKVRGVCKPECSMSSLRKSCCQWCSKQRPTLITLCFMKTISFKEICTSVKRVIWLGLQTWCCSNNSPHLFTHCFMERKVKELSQHFLY